MKHKKEITVAVLAIIALFVLYFGFNYLKGINIFNKTHTYVVKYERMNGLVAQSPVYVKGYKVGMVDRIVYDFSEAESFTVEFSINDDIRLPKGTEVALVPDGLISGEALELRIPTDSITAWYADGDTLPTSITPGMLNAVAEAVLSQLDPILSNIDSVVNVLQETLTKEQLQAILDNVDGTMANVNAITRKADRMMASQLPQLIDTIQLAMNEIHVITDNLSQADLKATVAKVDDAVAEVKTLLAAANSEDGTLGKLINDKSLYENIDHTIVSADSLLIDLKANPKRYVQFSLFGGNDKDKKDKK
ncbi:MAG: MCE family protein [Paludibacteraceae bacterium]|nr:MCE family protein [Paludibacteraceae bacterium]